MFHINERTVKIGKSHSKGARTSFEKDVSCAFQIIQTAGHIRIIHHMKNATKFKEKLIHIISSMLLFLFSGINIFYLN
jgi:hypothetical protein